MARLRTLLAGVVLVACAGETTAAPSTATNARDSTAGAGAPTTTLAPTTTVAATTTVAPAPSTLAVPTTVLTTDAPPFAVGTRTVTLVDTSRSTPANGDAPATPVRSLTTLLLYPAGGPPGPAPEPEAEPAESVYGFPLLVFAHGLGGNTRSLAAILPRLAAAGFVVAAPEFPLSKHTAPGGPTAGDYKPQPGDLSFVITQILSGEGGRLPAVDGGRVAVAGHSLGAITVIGLAGNSCCRDARVKAAIAISGFQGQFDGPPWYQPPVTPLLLLHGNIDSVVLYPGSVNIFNSAPSPVFLVTLLGANHWVFIDPWLDVVSATMIDFLHAELDDDGSALGQLAADANRPGVARLEQH